MCVWKDLQGDGHCKEIESHLPQALATYKALGEISGEAVEEPLVLRASETMILGRATRITGCLLLLFAEAAEDPVKLRNSVQALLKELRREVGRDKEESVLPRALYLRCQDALLMKP